MRRGVLLSLLICLAVAGCRCGAPPAVPPPADTRPVAARDTAPARPPRSPGIVIVADTRPARPASPGIVIADDRVPDPARILPLLVGTEATRLDRYERILREFGDLEYRNIGSILEGLTRATLLQQYPPSTHIITGGIDYLGANGGLIGELDLVVFDKAGHAELVGEMKLSTPSQLSTNRNHARRQLQRFQAALADGSIAKFKPASISGITLSTATFSACRLWVLYGPRGSTAKGYDREINITREEGERLQDRLVGAGNHD